MTITQNGKKVNRTEIHTKLVENTVDNVDNVDNNIENTQVGGLHRFNKCGKEKKKSTELYSHKCV